MNHVALRMPMLVLAIPENLDELLENFDMTSVAALSVACGIMVVAIDIITILII